MGAFQLEALYSIERGDKQFNFKVGYEIDYWFNQNQMIRFTPINPPNLQLVKQKGDVVFQGLVVEGGIGF